MRLFMPNLLVPRMFQTPKFGVRPNRQCLSEILMFADKLKMHIDDMNIDSI